MKSIFLEGLQAAREIVADGGLSALDAIILEHEKGTLETAMVTPKVESR
jgi:hypothetical protein